VDVLLGQQSITVGWIQAEFMALLSCHFHCSDEAGDSVHAGPMATPSKSYARASNLEPPPHLSSEPSILSIPAGFP